MWLLHFHYIQYSGIVSHLLQVILGLYGPITFFHKINCVQKGHIYKHLTGDALHYSDPVRHSTECMVLIIDKQTVHNQKCPGYSQNRRFGFQEELGNSKAIW